MNELQKSTYNTVADLIKKNQGSIAESLPKQISAARFSRIALSEIRSNPALLQCDPFSLMSSIMKAAQAGIELGSAQGYGHLVPFGRETTLIISYRGLIALARRSGDLSSIMARVVREGDVFELEYGLDEKLRHVPSTSGDLGELTHVYAIAKLKDGGTQYEVMSRFEVDQIRSRSRASKNGPWVTDYDEMARKTVVRRLYKYLPMSIEMASALESDEELSLADPAEINMGPVTPIDTLNESVKSAAAPRQDEQTSGDVAEEDNGAVPDIGISPAPPPSSYPITADGVMWDKRKIPHMPAVHALSCKSDDTWRRKRGVSQQAMHEAEEKYLLSLREEDDESEEALGEASEAKSSDESSQVASLSTAKAMIDAAQTADDLDVAEDFIQDAGFPDTIVAALEADIAAKRDEMIGEDF